MALRRQDDHETFPACARRLRLYPIAVRKYRFTAVVERDEDGLYVGIVPDLKGCHTQARTLAELEKRPVKQNAFIGVHQIEVAA